jgi:hypothetical protein
MKMIRYEAKCFVLQLKLESNVSKGIYTVHGKKIVIVSYKMVIGRYMLSKLEHAYFNQSGFVNVCLFS